MRTYGAYDESQRRGAAYWQRHQALVNRAGNVETYLKGAVPRWEPEGKAPAAEQKEYLFFHVTRR